MGNTNLPKEINFFDRMKYAWSMLKGRNLQQEEFMKEIKEIRNNQAIRERRIERREDELAIRRESLEKRENSMIEKENRINEKEIQLDLREKKLNAMQRSLMEKLNVFEAENNLPKDMPKTKVLAEQYFQREFSKIREMLKDSESMSKDEMDELKGRYLGLTAIAQTFCNNREMKTLVNLEDGKKVEFKELISKMPRMILQSKGQYMKEKVVFPKQTLLAIVETIKHSGIDLLKSGLYKGNSRNTVDFTRTSTEEEKFNYVMGILNSVYNVPLEDLSCNCDERKILQFYSLSGMFRNFRRYDNERIYSPKDREGNLVLDERKESIIPEDITEVLNSIMSQEKNKTEKEVDER